jgi:hypothetical protein
MNQVPTSEEALTVSVADLQKNTPPEVWSAFLVALKAYADQKATETVQSPPGDALHISQGRAQNAAAFLKLVQESKLRADKIMEKYHGQRPAPVTTRRPERSSALGY